MQIYPGNTTNFSSCSFFFFGSILTLAWLAPLTYNNILIPTGKNIHIITSSLFAGILKVPIVL